MCGIVSLCVEFSVTQAQTPPSWAVEQMTALATLWGSVIVLKAAADKAEPDVNRCMCAGLSCIVCLLGSPVLEPHLLRLELSHGLCMHQTSTDSQRVLGFAPST